jgi:hypothetical protein
VVAAAAEQPKRGQEADHPPEGLRGRADLGGELVNAERSARRQDCRDVEFGHHVDRLGYLKSGQHLHNSGVKLDFRR